MEEGILLLLFMFCNSSPLTPPALSVFIQMDFLEIPTVCRWSVSGLLIYRSKSRNYYYHKPQSAKIVRAKQGEEQGVSSFHRQHHVLLMAKFCGRESHSVVGFYFWYCYCRCRRPPGRQAGSTLYVGLQAQCLYHHFHGKVIFCLNPFHPIPFRRISWIAEL